MKLAVYLADQNPHRDRTQGITELTSALLEQLAMVPNVEMTTIQSQSSYQFGRNEQEKCLPWRTDRMAGRLLTDNFHPLFCRPEADVWLYPKGYLPFFFKPSAPCVGIVHDTILLWYFDHYRQERSRLDYMYWLNLMKRSIARFDVILTISHSAKNQILDLCSRFSIVFPPIEVVYESVRYAQVKETLVKGNYVIHVASKAPHKKTAWLIENWARALESGKTLPLLKLVGSLPESVKSVVALMPNVEKMPFLDDAAYQQALASARALIMPSEIEGFGLPAVEAYCLGTPACYVDGTAVDEVLAIPKKTGAFELSRPDSLFAALDEVLALSPQVVAETRARLQSTYSAEKFADRVRDVLIQAAGKKDGRSG